MNSPRLRKLLYRLGLIAPFWEVDRYRYLKRLARPQTGDWRYAAASDAAQFSDDEVVIRITGIKPPVFIHCDRRSVIEAEIIKNGAFQRHLMDLGRDLILPGSLVLDVGANIGAYALPWAACHPDVTLHCFEPHPLVRARLTRNVALNRLADRVKVHAEALSDRDGEATLYAVRGDEDNQGLSTLNSGIVDPGRADPITVPLRQIDDVFGVEEGKISLVKIDVQGHELEVLRGGTATLARHRPVLIFEHEDGLVARIRSS